MSENQVFKTPTQPLDLPSKGKFYPKESPLSSGQVELYLPTAMHEDILTNRNYIQQQTVIDKFLQAIIASKIDYGELLVGDKNAIMIGARILAYGSKYSFSHKNPKTGQSEEVTVDLGSLKEKEIDWSEVKDGSNEFDYELPMSKVVVTFKLLTHKDERNIDSEITGMQKISKGISGEVTVRLFNSILAINGNRDVKTVRDFVKSMPMQDSQALRKKISALTPDIPLKFDFTDDSGEVVEGLSIPMTVDFFWPDLGV